MLSSKYLTIFNNQKTIILLSNKAKLNKNLSSTINKKLNINVIRSLSVTSSIVSLSNNNLLSTNTKKVNSNRQIIDDNNLIFNLSFNKTNLVFQRNYYIDNYYTKSFSNKINLNLNLNLKRDNHQSDNYRAKRKNIKFKITPLDKRFKMEWPKITLFGDSITRRSLDPDNGCWGSMLAYRFGEYFDLDVRGFEGYNTKWALENVEKLFPKSYLDKVEIFNIFFGHNDSWMKEFALHVPVDEYEKNVRSIIKYLNDNGIENRKIILITPTWFHKEEANKFLSQVRDMNGMILDKQVDDAKKYSDAILKIAQENNIDCVDFFKVSLECKNLKEMFCDGIHFSKIGAKMLYDLLMPIMEKKLELSFKKSIGDLWHLAPYDQIPEVKKQFEAIAKKQL